MEMTKSKQLRIVLKNRPRSHPMTSQNSKMIEVAKKCGIYKGISQYELVDKMVNCVPGAWKEEI